MMNDFLLIVDYSSVTGITLHALPHPLSFKLTWQFNPSNAEATFIQSTRAQHFLRTVYTLSCWYSMESSRSTLR